MMLSLLLIQVSLLAATPAPTPAPADAVPPRPAMRMLHRSLGGVKMSIQIRPGVPMTDGVTSVKIELFKDGPAGGVPVTGAKLTATIAPDLKATPDRKLRRGLRAVRKIGRVVHSLPDRGSYGFQASLATRGAYSVRIQGELAEQAVDVRFGLFVDLWPAPDLEAEKAQQPSGRSSGRRRRPLRRR